MQSVARIERSKHEHTSSYLPEPLSKPSLVSAKPLDIPCLEEASFKRLDLNAGPLSNFVDTEAGVAGLIEGIQGLLTDPPSLYIDLKGINLSRYGSISILQVFVLPLDKAYLIDIHTLKEKAFLQPASNGGQTLLDVLESPRIPKVFFDVRNDSDALFSHLNVELAGVIDLQLMELAARNFSRRHVKRVGKMHRERCSHHDSRNTKLERIKGESYEIFNIRPLPNDVLDYCVQDVRFLPKLWRHTIEKCPHSGRKWLRRRSRIE